MTQEFDQTDSIISLPLSQFEKLDFSKADTENSDDMNRNIAATTITNINILETNLSSLEQAQSLGLQPNEAKTAFDRTAHSRPVSAEGVKLLNKNIEDVDLDKVEEMSLLELKQKLELALATEKQVLEQTEIHVTGHRMQIVEVSRYLKTEREIMDKILEHAPYKVDELLALDKKMKGAPYCKAEQWFTDIMNTLAVYNKKYHLRKSTNLGEAWDNAAGLIEVLKEDSEILENRQTNYTAQIKAEHCQQAVYKQQQAALECELQQLRSQTPQVTVDFK